MNGSPMQSDARTAASTRLASLRRFLAAEPDNARLRRDLVDTAVAAGEFEYLREFAESRLAAEPGNAEAQYDRATALIGLKDYSGALEALQPLDATIPGVRLNTALCLFLLGRHSEALPYLEASYNAGELPPPMLRVFVQTLHHLGDMERATQLVEANEAAAAADPGVAGACSLVYLDVNDAARAGRYAQLALSKAPNNLDALVSIGTLQAAALDVAPARETFQRVLGFQPENGRAWVGLASLSFYQQDFGKAEQEIERGLKAMPTHVGSWHLLGWMRLMTNRIDEAEAAFLHALELNHNFSESHAAMAVIAAKRGDRVAAERGIEVALRLDPACMTAQYARSLLAGNAEEQNKIIADAIAGMPGPGRQLAAMLRKNSKTP